MSEKINILTKDQNFKMLFGSNQNIHIVTSFLSAYLKIPYNYLINNVELLKQELDPQPNLINQSVDVLVKMPNGNKIQIEMNRIPRNWTNQRNFLYAVRNYLDEFKTKYGKKTEEVYEQDIRYLQINFNAYKEENSKMISVYKIQNDKNETFIDNFEIHTINIPECKKSWYNGTRDSVTRWASVFASTNEEELWEIVGDDLMEKEAKEEFRDAVRIIKKGDPGWWDYELEYEMEKGYMEYQIKKEAKQEAKLETALNLKKLGVDVETISKATGLTTEEIDNLK